MTLPAALRDRITVSGECWLWDKIGAHGYGYVQWDGAHTFAHRLMYALFVGKIPRGKMVHHTCRTPACVNPAHLRVVTPREHCKAEGNHYGAKTHCKHGHEFTPENTRLIRYHYGEYRSCVACQRRRARESYRRRHGLALDTNTV